MNVAELPGRMGLLGALSGIPVYDWSDSGTRREIRGRIWLPADFELRYDEMYVAHSINAILVGEQAHFLYRVKQLADDEACRALASHRIKNFAERILGEPWELS